jgi:hypothetical protein
MLSRVKEEEGILSPGVETGDSGVERVARQLPFR